MCVKFLDLTLANAETAIDTVLVGLVREDIIAKLKSDIVKGLEGVELADD